MRIKFEPSGTHVHKGFLKVRVDLYPDVGDKTYPIHHIQVPVIPPEGYQGAMDMGIPVDQIDYDNWIDSLPKVWRLNPALCAFTKVPETIGKVELEDFTRQVFNKDAVRTLDDILTKPNSIHLVSPFLRDKLTLSDQKVQTKDIADLIGSVNGRFTNLVLPLEGGGNSLLVEPQTIDVGLPTWSSGGFHGLYTYTLMNLTNPANASGTIDTVKVRLDVGGTDIYFGMHFLVSGTIYECRDSESVGNVSSGAEQTITGLTIDVETDDVITIFDKNSSTSRIWWHSSGHSGFRRASGEVIDPSDQGDFSNFYDANAGMALYGTGTETPTGWANKFNGVANAAIGKVNGVAIANVKQVNGVA